MAARDRRVGGFTHDVVSDAQVEALIERGAFIVVGDDLIPDDTPVVSLLITRFTLKAFSASSSPSELAGYLGWTEEAVLAAVAERRLYAVEVLGQTRLPGWQFPGRGPGIVLPGLARVLEIVPAEWPPEIIEAFMTSPQARLATEAGRVTPIEWLLAGQDVEAVVSLIINRTWGS